MSLGGPRQYQAVAEQALGINENRKGLPVGQKIDSVEITDINGEPFKSDKPGVKSPHWSFFTVEAGARSAIFS